MSQELVFYELRSNVHWTAFSLQRGVEAHIQESRFNGFEAYEATGQALSPDVSVHMRTLAADEPPRYAHFTVATVSGRQTANPARGLDVWTMPSMDHVVTAKGRDWIEALDPGVHGFYPVDMRHAGDGSRFGEQDYFVWRMGRALKITEAAQALAEPVTSSRVRTYHGPAAGAVGKRLVQLCYDDGLRHTVREMPFWTIAPFDVIFVGEAAFDAARRSKIKGSELSDARVERHATQIRLPRLEGPPPGAGQNRKGFWSRVFG